MSSRRSTVLLALAVACAGCATEPARRHLRVGDHRISIRTLPGWETIDRGREVWIRKGAIRVALRDLGPAGPLGIRREIERARDLWRVDRVEDARWRLRRLAVPNRRFATASQRETFWASWHEVSSASPDMARAAVEAGFDRLLEDVAALEEPTLEALSGECLSDPGDDRRREAASSRRILVDGRPAIVVDTWSRMTHQQRRRSALVYDHGFLLEARTEEGPFDEATARLEELLSSLRFRP